MRLESIALHGFKSFGEKTVVRVLPGITGIVGPNGCGKSNISEAVRWALGEQSAKSLRGQRMEDLIFHGSSSRKPVGFAEAELTFSNDGVLSVPWTEVAVSRRLYRTGESEYFLNKNASRLRDILDLFAGTGANPRAYSDGPGQAQPRAHGEAPRAPRVHRGGGRNRPLQTAAQRDGGQARRRPPEPRA